MLAAERLHGDDTTIRILAKGKCTTGRIWTYVRDDRPFAGPAPPAAVYYASSDRRGEHPQKHLAAFAGILQADCYNGFEPLFDPQKKMRPITPAFCFAHARRGFFELADIEKNARALLSSFFTKLDLVSREEFDIQAQVLLRTREKLKTLEERVDQLESKGSNQ